jgi:hypothetical protein
MAESSQDCVDAPNPDRVYRIEKIRKHKVIHKNDTRFLVKWENCPLKQSSYEPLDNILVAPRLIYEYVQAAKKKLAASRPPDPNVPEIPFPEIPQVILRTCRAPDEFIPRRYEHIRKIDLVRFWDNPDLRRVVRKAIMIYYFPIESLIFLQKKFNRENKIWH